MDYYLAIAYQLPNLAHYRYCYRMHDVARFIYHVIMVGTCLWDTKCMMTIIALVHMKCIKHTQLIIRIVHLIIIGVSTWNCMAMNKHKMGILNEAFYNG